jgi:hypothetical protein
MLALETTLEIRMNLKYLLLTSGLSLTSSLSAADFHQYESARNDKSASRGAKQRAAAAAAVREANLRENYTKHEQQQGRTRALMKMKINQNLMAMKSLLIHKTLTPM